MSKADAGSIRRALSARTAQHLDELDVFSRIDSTNTYLLDEPPPPAGRCRVAIADEQTAGRGRRARGWVSPAGSGLYLSMAYTFGRMPDGVAALTLALGVCVANALRASGVRGVRLKWPNDIMLGDGKLGGMLTETRTVAGSPGISVVSGIGINIAFQTPPVFDRAPVQEPVDLRSRCESVPEQDELAVRVIDALYAGFDRFAGSGFAYFARDWRQLDWLQGTSVTVEADDGTTSGIAAGVDGDGTLLVDTDHGRERVISGTITAAAPRKETNP